MYMTEELLDKLISLNIGIELVEGDKLKVHTDIKKIPPELLSEIKLRKEELIDYLAQRHSSLDFVKIPAIDVAPDYALSSNQRRLWLLGQFTESNIAYNIPRIYVFEGHLDQDALEFSFRTLIDRHDS